MPCKKGSKLKAGNRNYIFGKEFYSNLTKNHNITMSRKECSDLIRSSNKVIADIILNDIAGYKLSNGMGYLATTKFKPKKDAINWKETKRLKKYVYHLNLHTFGYSPRVCWYRVGRINNTSFSEVYKFQTWTTLKKDVSQAFKNGKQYKHWDTSDFIEMGRLENLYNKKFRPELSDKYSVNNT